MESNCTWMTLLIIFVGSIGNSICLRIFSRKKLRSSNLSIFFVSLIVADTLYLIFRVFKLFYYQQAIFHQLIVGKTCDSSWLIQVYGYIIQSAPQIFIPLFHYEFYVRFSLLLMCCLGLQRAFDMYHASTGLVNTKSSVKVKSYYLIIPAFIGSYSMELLELNVFCSRELSSDVAYEWFSYIHKNLTNETSYLIQFMQNQSANQWEIDCLFANQSNCPQEDVRDIISE